MTSLFSARKRADEFEAFVEGTGSAGAAAERLGAVVTILREQPPVLPRPEFSAQLRARLMAEAQTLLTPENAGLRLPVRARGPRERRLVAAASAVVLIGGTAGMAAAAQDALPGDPLYPVKRGIEHAEAGLSLSPAGRGRDLLQQADDRLTEVRVLLAEDSVTGSAQVPATLDDFTSQAREGSQLLMTSFQQNRNPDSIVAVRTFAAQGVRALQDLAHTAPTETQDGLADAAQALTEIDRQAAALCDTCASGLPVLDLPRMFLAASQVDQVLRKVRAADLDNSHPVIVPEDAVQKFAGSDPAPTSAPDTSSGSEAEPPTAQKTDSPDLGLPTKEQIKRSDGTLGDLVDDTVDGATDGVDGLTTLLPDPTDSDGLLN